MPAVSRLPNVGSDLNNWGQVLNDYLTKTKGESFYVDAYGADPNGGVDSTAAIQATLNAAQGSGGGRIVPSFSGTYLISAPLRIGSNCWLDAGSATMTLLAGSLCNCVQNWAVQANRRVIDGVTTATSATFTSATAAFVSGDTGSRLRVYYTNGTYLDTTITYASATTVTMAATAAYSGTALYACIGTGRDSNIRVTGGYWVRQDPNGTDYNSHNMRFRHCDRLEIGQLDGTTAANSGKFFVSIGDCTVFNVHDINPVSTASDTVHIQGPASTGYIARISNPFPGDDVVAFTCNDYVGYNDTCGNITDITVDGVQVPAAGGNGVPVKILAGQSLVPNPYLIDRITIRDVRSMTDNYVVNICTDTGSVNDQGGTWGTIVVDGVSNINPASTFPAVNVIAAVVSDLTVRAASNVNPANTNVMVVQANATVTRLVTDANVTRVALVSGCVIGTYINETRIYPVPLYQSATMYGDGSSISASVADTAVLDITGPLSVEMWISPSPSQVGFWTPLCKVGQYFLEGDSGGALTLKFNVVSGATTYGSAVSPVLQAGRLNHIVGTSVSSVVTLYVNGVAPGSGGGTASALATTANALLIGNRSGFSRYFAGQIADVRIWNGALTTSDVGIHYADPTSVLATSATLAARWVCNEGTGTTLTDSSGGAHNATLSSASWNGPQLATGASHTVDDVITALQKIGLVHQ